MGSHSRWQCWIIESAIVLVDRNATGARRYVSLRYYFATNFFSTFCTLFQTRDTRDIIRHNVRTREIADLRVVSRKVDLVDFNTRGTESEEDAGFSRERKKKHNMSVVRYLKITLIFFYISWYFT